MGGSLWQQCLKRLESEVPPQQFNTWIRPLQAVEADRSLTLLAPNRFVLEWIRDRYLNRIVNLVLSVAEDGAVDVQLRVGTRKGMADPPAQAQPVRSRVGKRAGFCFERAQDGLHLRHTRRGQGQPTGARRVGSGRGKPRARL